MMWPGDKWWQCERCNFIHFEADPPKKCSVCRYDHFVKVLLASGDHHVESPSTQPD